MKMAPDDLPPYSELWAEDAWWCGIPEDFKDSTAEAFWAQPGASVEIEIQMPGSKRGQKHMIHSSQLRELRGFADPAPRH